MSRKQDPNDIVHPTLPEVLAQPGVHTWRFTQSTSCETIDEACRRLTSGLSRKPKVRAEYYGSVLVNHRPPYDGEPVLIVHVRHVK